MGTVLAFATFAVGFVARPLGGIVFGHFGDKLGRKKMLVLTLEIMGVATVGIGLVPSYETIGILAPILLVLCRLAQGIGIGGEWGGAVLMAFESAPPHKRAFYGSLPQVGLALGLMLASGVIGLLSFFLSDEAFLAWGWRVAFILSAVLVGVGAYIRISVQETQDFSSARKKTEQVKYPILAAFKHYPRTLTACVGARFVEGIAFNVFGVFSLTYLTGSCGLDKTVSLFIIVGAAAVMAVAIPFWGMRADTWGRARIFGIAAILLGITAYPTFWVLHNYSHNVLLVFLAIALPFGIIYGAAYATMSSLFSGSFEPTVRYSAVSFIYQFSGIFASGLTPHDRHHAGQQQRRPALVPLRVPAGRGGHQQPEHHLDHPSPRQGSPAARAGRDLRPVVRPPACLPHSLPGGGRRQRPEQSRAWDTKGGRPVRPSPFLLRRAAIQPQPPARAARAQAWPEHRGHPAPPASKIKTELHAEPQGRLMLLGPGFLAPFVVLVPEHQLRADGQRGIVAVHDIGIGPDHMPPFQGRASSGRASLDGSSARQTESSRRMFMPRRLFSSASLSASLALRDSALA